MWRRHSGFGWMELIVGILLVILGIFTLARPGALLTGLVFLYGILAVCTGIGDLVLYVRMERHMGFGPTISLVSGILIISAVVILRHIIKAEKGEKEPVSIRLLRRHR